LFLNLHFFLSISSLIARRLAYNSLSTAKGRVFSHPFAIFHIHASSIAPPTALVTEEHVLWLEDKFAEGRNFFDDDPKIELANNGLVEADFTEKKAWDRFPAAQNLLRIWDICETFVKAFVSNSYRDDAAVAADKGLQKWMENAAKPDQGNIRGLPQLKDCDALIRLLTSQLYRLTAHGVSRLPRSTDPWLTFVANFPPCLQRMEFPAPDVDLGTQELLKYLPNLKTIAGMMGFYYAFAYSKPYTSMIPGGGTDRDLDFPGGATLATRRSFNIATASNNSLRTTLRRSFRRDTTALATRSRGCSGR
jgi:hypothetical protein